MSRDDSRDMRSAHQRAHLRWHGRFRVQRGLEHVSGPLARLMDQLGIEIPEDAEQDAGNPPEAA